MMRGLLMNRFKIQAGCLRTGRFMLPAVIVKLNHFISNYTLWIGIIMFSLSDDIQLD